MVFNTALNMKLIIIVFNKCYVIWFTVTWHCVGNSMQNSPIFYHCLYVSFNIFFIFWGGKSCPTLEDPPRNTIESVHIPLRVSAINRSALNRQQPRKGQNEAQ